MENNKLEKYAERLAKLIKKECTQNANYALDKGCTIEDLSLKDRVDLLITAIINYDSDTPVYKKFNWFIKMQELTIDEYFECYTKGGYLRKGVKEIKDSYQFDHALDMLEPVLLEMYK